MKSRIIINCPLSADNVQVCVITNEFKGLDGGVARKLHIGGVAMFGVADTEDIIPTCAVLRFGGMVVTNRQIKYLDARVPIGQSIYSATVNIIFTINC